MKKKVLSMLVLLAAVATGAVAQTPYKVSVKEGTEDASNWQGKAGEGNYQALPLTGVEAGTAVSVKYNGTKKVKSVKARKKVAPAAELGHALSASVVGDIVGSDGKAYAVADKDKLPSNVTAAGMVAYKSETAGQSLVIALTDEANKMTWNTATGATGVTAHTPVISGYSWKLPSKDEWEQMFSANGGDQANCSVLNTAIKTAGGTALLVETGIYWTCTETAYVSGHYIAYLDHGDVHFYEDNNNNLNSIRACIAF